MKNESRYDAAYELKKEGHIHLQLKFFLALKIVMNESFHCMRVHARMNGDAKLI